MMNLLTPRMLRSFAIGLVLGTLVVVTMAGIARSPDGGQVVPSAIAAPAR